MAWQSIEAFMAQLDQHICFLLDVATRRITKFYNRRLRPFGITYNHLFILTCLWEQDGVHVKDLAHQLCLDSSSLTGHLDRLERSALVVRQDDPDDRRGVEGHPPAGGPTGADPGLHGGPPQYQQPVGVIFFGQIYCM